MKLLQSVPVNGYDLDNFILSKKYSLKLVELEEKNNSPLLCSFEKAWGLCPLFTKLIIECNQKMNTCNGYIFFN